MNRHIAATALLAIATAVPQAWGNSVPATFTFNSPPGNVGDSYTYTSSGISVTAWGFDGTSTTSENTPTALYDNTVGLGLANDNYNKSGVYEIPINEFVQLQIPNLASSKVNFEMTDVNTGWLIYGSMTSGELGTKLLQSGTDSNLDTLVASAANYNYIDVIAGADCETVLNQLQITTATPEPTTYMLTGLALGVLGIAGKKLRKRG